MNRPKYKHGDRIGRLTVTEVLEYSTRHLVQKRQWYKVECICGNTQEVTQNNLNKKRMCPECANHQRGISESITKRKPIGIPDFARMKL